VEYIVITDIKPYDGRYELDLSDDSYTVREWGWIRRLADYRPVTYGDGLRAADAELFAVLAVIAMRRAGRIETADVEPVHGRLLDAGFGSNIALEVGDQEAAEEADASPPDRSSTGNASSSGDGSTTSSEISASSDGDPRQDGTAGSDSSASDLLRSVN